MPRIGGKSVEYELFGALRAFNDSNKGRFSRFVTGAKGKYEALVVCGDCVEIMRELPCAQFIFADPPFNIGQAYKGYADKVEPYEYNSRLESWISRIAASCIGCFALHGPDELCERYLGYCGYLGLERLAWINWHYRFGQCSRSNWIDARCHCLIYKGTTSSKVTWNPEAVLVDSDRVAYGDKRVHETERGGKRLPGTIWGTVSDGAYWGRVQGNSEERRAGHPNQLPEVYLARLIKAYTNEGDLVIDPFSGSGTTGVVAQALNRRAICIDISEENCKSIVERLKKGAVRV